MKPLILQAAHREATSVPPVWIMRQAGRYQKEYRAIRERVSFIELCKDSDLATEVTLLPIAQFDFDAAIVFADILLLLEPLQVGFTFTEEGPRISKPLNHPALIDALPDEPDVVEALYYVMNTVRQVRRSLDPKVGLIGFAAAPFTLAAYLIEGGSSRTYQQTKQMMHQESASWRVLMSKLASATVEYLEGQIAAGAQMVQLFDSWVGCLSPTDYQEFVAPYSKQVLAALSQKVPVIHFGTGNPALYPAMKQAGGDVIGVDWRTNLVQTWDVLGDVALMGNLDPVILLTDEATIRQNVRRILRDVRGRPGHIFNLGHGVLPSTPPAHVRYLVEAVREESASLR